MERGAMFNPLKNDNDFDLNELQKRLQHRRVVHSNTAHTETFDSGMPGPTHPKPIYKS